MRLRSKINSFFFGYLIFYIFLGHYALLLFFFNTGFSEASRAITIPTRVVVGLVCLFILLFNLKRLEFTKEAKWFFFFSILYLFRILIDTNQDQNYYLSPIELIAYFILFMVLPFCAINSFRLEKRHFSIIFNNIFITGIGFSLLALYFYSKFIGQVARLSTATAKEEVLSPLILSYCSTLIIGVFSVYLAYNKTTVLKKIIAIFGIALSTVPFFLGASRGALVALFLPFLLLFFAKKSLSFILKGLFLISLAIICLVYLDNSLDSGLLNRFMAISEEVEMGNSQRVDLWASSFNQFLENPFFGDKLKTNISNSYPHNIFLEVLQTTGLLGFIPFMILLLNSLIKSVFIFKHHLQYSWISIIFLQVFFQHLFSNSIHNGAWLWASMALLFCVHQFLTKNNK